METEKTEKIFELICEVPMKNWYRAKVSNNFIVKVNGNVINVHFHELITAVIHYGDFSFAVENIMLANELKKKLINYFELKDKEEHEKMIDELYGVLTYNKNNIKI